jgi:hypothetical protein
MFWLGMVIGGTVAVVIMAAVIVSEGVDEDELDL